MSAPTTPPPPQEQISPSVPAEDTGTAAAGQPSVIQEGTQTVPEGRSDGPLTLVGESAAPQPQITVEGVPDSEADHVRGGGQNMREELPLSKLGL
jgi:hypothetical protein